MQCMPTWWIRKLQFISIHVSRVRYEHGYFSLADAKQARDQYYLKARSRFVADAVSRDSGCFQARSRFVADVADAGAR